MAFCKERTLCALFIFYEVFSCKITQNPKGAREKDSENVCAKPAYSPKARKIELQCSQQQLPKYLNLRNPSA